MNQTQDAARRSLIAAGILGFLAVACGAFGAHGIESAMQGAEDSAKRLGWWVTGVRYQMWHSLLLLGIAQLQTRADSKALRVAFGAVLIGVLLFSGLLYVMTLTHLKILGAIVPLGGTAFLVSWAAVAWHAFRHR